MKTKTSCREYRNHVTKVEAHPERENPKAKTKEDCWGRMEVVCQILNERARKDAEGK